MIKNMSLASACLAMATSVSAAETPWTYDGPKGADRWGQLDSAFEKCEAGIMQSPIDLDGANAKGSLDVGIDYKTSPLTTLNNGHTVQANFAAGSTMTSGNMTFNLIQVHFHTPSEHKVDGKSYPLTAHFVHASDTGKLAVLGIMFEEGSANAELAKIVAAASPSKSAPIVTEGVALDPGGMLPNDLNVYRYMGSLTTPPCSERVNWHVVAQPVSASVKQIEAMKIIMGNNARPIQLLNGRLLVAPK